MTIRHAITLSLAGLLFATSFAAAEAATRARHATHATAAHSRSSGRVAPASNADRSADQLNAQSLSRAQGATQ